MLILPVTGDANLSIMSFMDCAFGVVLLKSPTYSSWDSFLMHDFIFKIYIHWAFFSSFGKERFWDFLQCVWISCECTCKSANVTVNRDFYFGISMCV